MDECKKISLSLPQRDEIEYVKIDQNLDKMYRNHAVYNYQDLLIKEIEFEDEDVIDTLYECFKTSNQVASDQRNGIYQEYASYGSVICEFKLANGKSIFKKINIYYPHMDNLYDALISNQEYMDAYAKLPPDGQLVDRYHQNFDEVIIQQTKENFEKEYLSMPFDQKMVVKNIYNGRNFMAYKSKEYFDFDMLTMLQIIGVHNDVPYYVEYPICEYVPITASAYMKAKNAKYQQEMSVALEEVMKNDAEVKTIITMQIREQNNHIYMMYSNDENKEQEMIQSPEFLSDKEYGDIVRLISQQNLQMVDISKSYITVRVNQYGKYSDQNVYYDCYVPISEQEMDGIVSLYNQKMNFD